MRRLIALAFVCLLAACASPGPVARPQVELPPLRLSPASLGKSLSLQQRLHFAFGTQKRDLDALLEADPGEVRLLVQAMGQSGVRLSWNGSELQERRAPWLPPAVRGERVLDDLQFVLWPADAIRAALPSGWTLEESDGERSLQRDGRVWLRASGDAANGNAMLENLAEGYRLQIESAPGAEPSPS